MDEQTSSRRAIFLDRDGTINREVNYLSDPSQIELLPGAAETIAYWNSHNWMVVLVTNQAGVGRGYFPTSAVEAVHQKLQAVLAERGARLDGIYFCPHSTDDACSCRKPNSRLFVTASRELGIDLKRSFLIGDKLTDVMPARELGAKAILVRTGYGEEQSRHLGEIRGIVVKTAIDLREAKRIVEENS